jgi:tetratricopeptide (TPR) repeat protein
MPESFSRVFETSKAETQLLVLTDPAEVARDVKPALKAAWKLLIGAMALRKAGYLSEANDWLNNAVGRGVKDDVFQAELLTEAGLALNASDRLADALTALNSAEAFWRDATSSAVSAANGKAKKIAASLGALLQAVGIKGGGSAKPSKDSDATRIRSWLHDRAVRRRAETSATLARILIKAGRLDDATALCSECQDWILADFTTPPGAVAAGLPLKKRQMSPAAREGLYILLLAQGEIELAGNKIKTSANTFGAAADIYDGNQVDYADISRLLRAKFNQANSLLRLKQYKKVVDIYDLVEGGFHSIGDTAAADRVAQARLIARSKLEDDAEP